MALWTEGRPLALEHERRARNLTPNPESLDSRADARPDSEQARWAAHSKDHDGTTSRLQDH